VRTVVGSFAVAIAAGDRLLKGRTMESHEPVRAGLRAARPVPILLVALALLPSPARAWWNDDWSSRKQFAIDTSASGASVTEPIGPAAVLVRLHSGNFKLEGAKDDAGDLRFIAADDKTPLKFHLEKFDPLLGEALAWVAIPDLKPGARTLFWIYSGNPKAVAAEDVKGTYDPGTALVYHFTERDQPARDSSPWGNQALGAGRAAEGAIIGRGLRLEGTPLGIPGGPSLAWSAGGQMTWSLWVKPAEASQSAVLYSRREGGSHLVIGLEGGRPFAEVSGPNGPLRASASTAIAVDSWRQVTVTAGQDLAVYLDGALEGKAQAALPALKGTAFLGGEGEPAEPQSPPARKGEAQLPARLPGFKGEVDELQIAKVERPRGFIRVAAIGQGTAPGKLVVAGQEEEKGSWASGYMTIIVRSVTLDGWVVIGLLAIMSFISWVVMAKKASYMHKVERANERFLEGFHALELTQLVERNGAADPPGASAVRDSPLHRLYQGAAQEIRRRSDGTRPLHAESIEAIRATLDAGLVRESQRLNRSMVLLTIAISGGPFLGLLGTVIGVMITFASIAAAGDVNVNAIAPGIAAALVATVAGLTVAIPALFGYNWLVTRARNISAGMQVFLDELVTRIAEEYSERVIAEKSGPRLAQVE
jgi:biopolymer transport protein ExbB